ncbi:MAG: hypothetical protein J0L52_05075 [Caulobacterales bacterium]|nr:hypothetical protein [Caulobacterales bacterium]
MSSLRLPLSLILLAGLAACGPAVGANSGDGPAQSGIYAYTMPDGTEGSMVLHSNGDYAQMVDNEPLPIEQGTWRRHDGQFCLDDGAGAEACFDEAAVGADGFSLTRPGDSQPLVFTLRAGG